MFGDRILYTTTAGGKNSHGHFHSLPRQHQWCIKYLGLWEEDFYTPLALRLKTLQLNSPKNQCHHSIKFGLANVSEEKGTQTVETQTFWSGYLRLAVGVFHVKGWGPKSSVCPSKPRETKLLAAYPGTFAGISRQKIPNPLLNTINSSVFRGAMKTTETTR